MDNRQPSPLTIDWAELVDLFAKEYGWTLADITELTMPQILLLIRAIEKRYRREKEAIEKGGKHSGAEEANETNVRNLALKLGGKITKNKDGKEEIVI